MTTANPRMKPAQTSRHSHRGAPSPASDESVQTSSGNVFADLDLASAKIDELKLDVAVAINQELRGLGGSQIRRSQILGLDQSTLSLLENYELSRFSLDRLCRYAHALDIPLRSLV